MSDCRDGCIKRLNEFGECFIGFYDEKCKRKDCEACEEYKRHYNFQIAVVIDSEWFE